MLQGLFCALMGGSLLYGWAAGRIGETVQAMLDGASEAVTAAIGMAGGFGLFCGLMGILRRAGAMEGLARRLAPALQRLLGPSLPREALGPVTMNLAANALGLGNAATPMGVEAARLMAAEGGASNALCMFLVINASSVQLLPTSVIALRAAAGSADPGAVIVPSLAATALSTLTGILACKALEKRL